MRRVKSLLCLVFAILCCVCLVACGGGEEPDNRPTFVVGMECDYPPFNWTEMTQTDTNYPIDGTSLYAEGYDVQVAKMIADELDMYKIIFAGGGAILLKDYLAKVFGDDIVISEDALYDDVKGALKFIENK